LHLGANFVPDGDLTSLVIRSDDGKESYAIKGNLHVPSASEAAGGSPSVTGTVTDVDASFGDGSRIAISGAAFGAGDSVFASLAVLANGDLYAGNDSIDLTLPAAIDRAYTLDAGAGNDKVTVGGGGVQFGVNAGAGNDTVELLDGGHHVDGGAGSDTVVLHGHRADYVIAPAGATLTVKHGADAADVLAGVENIRFDDATYDDRIDGVFGQTYRLYKAAFGRAPDAGGQQFWIGQMQDGLDLRTVAEDFTKSAEYKALYPANLDNAALIDHYYHNILGRAPDKGGLDYWVNVLDTHAATAPQVLAFISESPENHDATAALIGVAAP
jgi:hypothetical protein